ncbi:DEKNAAC104275 [Brettanomyces naardenensis]|uniref:DEKNAAC104275 n=1 Tax=Brettanomyces naardenensis TaxID=13370 RepID=A0A448YQ90_BRENA|nr:DEKNAAC104275 [Brettanomyces naardenensis]
MPSYSATPLFSIQEIVQSEENRSSQIYEDHSFVTPSSSQNFSISGTSSPVDSSYKFATQLMEFKTSEIQYIDDLKVLLTILDSFDSHFDNYFDGSHEDDDCYLQRTRELKNSKLIDIVKSLLHQHEKLGQILDNDSDLGVFLLEFSRWSLNVHPFYSSYMELYRLDIGAARTEVELRRVPLVQLLRISRLLEVAKRSIYYCLDSQSQMKLQDLVSNLELASQRFSKALQLSRSMDHRERERILSLVNFSSVKSLTGLLPVCSNIDFGSTKEVFSSELFYKNDKLATAVNFQKTEMVFLESKSPSLALVKVEENGKTLLFPPLRQGELVFCKEVERSVYLLKHCLSKDVELYITVSEKDPQRSLSAKQKLMEMFPTKKGLRDSQTYSSTKLDGLGISLKNKTDDVQEMDVDSNSPVVRSPVALSPVALSPVALSPVAAAHTFAAHLQKRQANLIRSNCSSSESKSISSFSVISDPVERCHHGEVVKISEQSPTPNDNSSPSSSHSVASSESASLLSEHAPQLSDNTSNHQEEVQEESPEALANDVLRSVIDEGYSSSTSSSCSSMQYEIDLDQPMEQGVAYLSKEDVTINVSTEAEIYAPVTKAKEEVKEEVQVQAIPVSTPNIPVATSNPPSHHKFDPALFAKTYENALLDTSRKPKKKGSFFNKLSGMMNKKKASKKAGRIPAKLPSIPVSSSAQSDLLLKSISSSPNQFYLQDVKYFLWQGDKWSKAEDVKLKWIYTQNREKFIAGYSLQADEVIFLIQYMEETLIKKLGSSEIQIKTVNYLGQSVTVMLKTSSSINTKKLVDIFNNEKTGEISNSSSQQSELSLMSNKSKGSSQTSVSVSSNLSSLLPPPKFSTTSSSLNSPTSTVSSSLLNGTLHSNNGSAATLAKRRDDSRLVFQSMVKLYLLCRDNRLESFGQTLFRVGDFNSSTEKQYLLRNLKVCLDIDLPSTAFRDMKENRILMNVSSGTKSDCYLLFFESAQELTEFWNVTKQ